MISQSNLYLALAFVVVAIVSFLFGMLTFELHERRLMRPHKQPEPVTVTPIVSSPQAPAVVQDPGFNDQLQRKVDTIYKTSLDAAAQKFGQDLATTSELINKEIKNLSSMVVTTELEQYREGLVKLREQVLATMGDVEKSVAEQRKLRMEDLDKEVAAEKQRMVSQIDTKLSDAVSSFLLETLQHNVDLGAQSGYLMATLAEYKDELKKEVTNEA